MNIAYYISVAASALSLVMAVIIFGVGYGNHGLQSEIQAQQIEVQKQQADLQKQQEQINTGNQISQQVGPNLLRDMAVSSLKNDKMKALLSKHGYNVQQATPPPGASAPAPPRAPAPAPSSTPAPAPTAAPGTEPALR